MCLTRVVGGVIRFPVQKSVSLVLSSVHILLSASLLSWHRFGELGGHPIRQNSLLSIFLVVSLHVQLIHDVRVGSQVHFIHLRDCQEKIITLSCLLFYFSFLFLFFLFFHSVPFRFPFHFHFVYFSKVVHYLFMSVNLDVRTMVSPMF